MNSDKIRDRLREIEGSNGSLYEKLVKVLEFYQEFIDLVAKNKVGMVTFAAATASEIGDYWRKLISDQSSLEQGSLDQGSLDQGSLDQGSLVPQNLEANDDDGDKTEVKETIPPLG